MKTNSRITLKNFCLTPRQEELAAHVAKGKSQKAIANAMGLSVHTVRNYMDILKRKINVSTTFEAGCFLAHYFPPVKIRR